MKNDEIEDIFGNDNEEKIEYIIDEEIEELTNDDSMLNSHVHALKNNPILNDKINNLAKPKLGGTSLGNLANKVNNSHITNPMNLVNKNRVNVDNLIQQNTSSLGEEGKEVKNNEISDAGKQLLSSKMMAQPEVDATLKKELANMVMKKILASKIGIAIAISLFVVIFIIIIVVLFTSINSDESEINTSNELIGVITGELAYEEITDYLVYLGICRDLSDPEDEKKACLESGFGKFVFEFKNIYEKYNEEPYIDQYGNYIELDIPLIMETISYNRTDNDLIATLENSSGYNQIINELYELAEAQVEYVQEIGDYYNSGCTLTKDKKIGSPYYMISDDKYISYLKYGKVHENYSGNVRIFDSIIHPDSVDSCIPEGLEYTPPDTLRYIGEEIVNENSNAPAPNPGMSTLLKDEESGMEYYIYRPDGTNTSGKPIIFAFHGTNPTSKEIGVGEFAAYELVKDKKVTPDAIIVYPTKNYSSSWVKYSSTSSEAQKISKFIKNIVEQEDADSNRVYYYGFSMGSYDAANIIKATGVGYFRAAVLNDGNPSNISNNNYLGLKGIYIIEAAENNFSGTSDNKANGTFNAFNGKFKLEDHSGNSHAWANGFAVADTAGDALGIWKCNEAGNAFGWLLSV